MKRLLTTMILTLVASAALSAQKERTIHIVTTGDVHGSWFDQPYIDGQKTRTSLMSVKHYVDSLRIADGVENVILIDAGDCLQGDNAAYYYNYVENEGPHLFSRMAGYMGYDAIVVGNHDIETGHAVYDKVNYELNFFGVPWLGGNIVWARTGKPYFPVYTILEKGGLRVAVLGFGNPNIKAWLSEPLWSGLDFLDLLPYVQECVDMVNGTEHPDITIVAVHSGTGDGDGKVLESEGLDLFRSLKNVDVLIGGHDHRTHVIDNGDFCYVDGGARAGYVGHCTVSAMVKGRKVVSKKMHAETVRLDKSVVDEEMRDYFAEDFDAVKTFTLKEVGTLGMTLYTRDAFMGMCDYMNLLHTVQINVPEAQISFAAPLTYNGRVRSGNVVYNDMFTIYPYENQMVVARMKGSEIKDYLEYSYDSWIQTPGEHILKIHKGADNRTGAERWSFEGRTYNFDSAAGLCYTVDVTKPFGSRICIMSLADGTAFDAEGWYNVAMTSYRANGGGSLVPEGAGISSEEMTDRIVVRYPEIRNLVYDYFKTHGEITSDLIGNKSVIGSWKFVPESVAEPLLKKDFNLVF